MSQPSRYPAEIADTPAANDPATLSGELGKSFFGSRLVSILHLFGGNIANSLLMLLGTALAARTLGTEQFGVFVLVLTLGRFSERLVRFESWQPLIRFAASEEQSFDSDRMASLFLYGLLLDTASCLLAAALTIGGGLLLMQTIGLQPEDLPLVIIFAAAIALNIRGFPTAALRLGGQFRTLAYLQTVSSFVRIVLAFVAFLMGLDVLAFILIWTGVQIFDTALFLFISFRSLKRQGVASPLKAQWLNLPQRFPGFMSFAWSTNISSTRRTMTQEADTLLVGALGGASSAGFYHIAKRVAKVAMQVGANVQAVMYPDMARLWAKLEIRAFRTVTSRLQLALLAIGLAALVATILLGKQAIALVLGSEFVEAYGLLIAQMVAVILILHSAPSRSALLSMGRPGVVLIVAALSTFLFFITAFVTMPIYGALGANLAHIAFGLLTAVALDVVWWRESRKAIEGSTD
ncbi:MAG: lipopolysaccharide biosynthesis protein [Erythrobacter sp.]|nr:lipopolysaccharide biosynthesis protein [Erythrobacter sp.]